MIKLDPSTGVRIVLNAQRADAAMPRPVELDMEFAAMGGEGPTPYEVLLHAALARAQDALQPSGDDRGGLAGHAAAHRRPPRCTRTPRDWGPAEADALVAEHGGWREPWI